MAKARAICRCRYCGNEFEYITHKHNSSEARSFEKWAAENIDECPDCKEKRISKEREEASRAAAEAAKAKAWPELTGTEKQIAWANRIRETKLGPIAEENERLKKEKGDRHEGYELINMTLSVLLDHTGASWWIDNREIIGSIFRSTAAAIEEDPKKYAREAQAEEVEEPSGSDEATIAKPENQTHSGIVDIRASENCVSAMYPKDDDFRQIVKSLGYRWNGDKRAWQLKIKFSTGAPAERAAELGNKLLNAGFAIMIQDPDTLRDAIKGNYEPMTYRWISRDLASGSFSISWGREDDLYSRAKKLPGARYVSPSIHVPAKEWVSVMDFAETYDFQFSPGAQEMISEMQGATVTVTPAASKNARYDERPLEDVLNSSRDIIEDLKDEINN